MSKPVLGIIVGAVLGAFDGLSALLSAPETAPQIIGIVAGSTIKGVIAGVAIGFFSRRFNSLPLGIVFGLAIGGVLAFGVALMQGRYYLEITLPGSIVGLILGFVTQRYGRGRDRPGAAASGVAR